MSATNKASSKAFLVCGYLARGEAEAVDKHL
jgi:hypothetical protein